MPYDLDLKDKKIIRELDYNCRLSNAIIGKRVRLSRDAVGYRIRSLENERVILGYYAVLDIARLGYVTYKFMLSFRDVNNRIQDEIIEYLKSSSCVGWLVSCDGHYNLMAVTWVRNAIEFNEFFTAFLKKYSRHVRERDIMVITENHACRKAYLYGDEEKADVYYSGWAECTLSKADLRILKLVANDSRIQLNRIAGSVGLTPEAVAYRIKQLQKQGIIQAFRVVLNTPLLGYQYYNVLFRLKKFDRINEMFRFFRMQPNIIYFVKYLGSYDVGIDLEVRSAEELREILLRIRERFNEDIESYDSVLIYQEHKLSYLP